MKHNLVRTLCSAVLLLFPFSPAAGADAAKAALALARQEVLAHFQSVDPANVEEAGEEIRYLRSISQPKRPFLNNLADDKQLRFTLRNLKKGGKTPENAPQLFATIARMRQAHKQAAPAAAVLSSDSVSDQRIPLSAITDIGPVAGSPATYSTTGLSSVPQGTIFTNASVQLFNASNDTPFGTGGFNEQFGGGEDLTVTQTSPATSPINGVGAALQVNFQANAKTDPQTVTVLDTVPGAPLAPPTVTAPVISPHVPPNTEVMVCLSRPDGKPDSFCDYGPFESPTPNPIVQFPLSGNITFDANVDTARTITGTLVVWAKEGGGACTLSFGQTPFAPAFTANGAQLSWLFTHSDGTGTINTASFGRIGNNPCWFDQSGQNFGMTLDVNVPLVGSVLPQQFFVTTTPGPPLSNAARIPPLMFTFGCFAAGSRILMADGSLKAIEDVQPGDVLIADASGRKLTVHRTTEGREARPMVIITDARGHTLSVTDGHAVVIRNGKGTKVVLAKELKEGDVIFSSDLALENGKPRHYAAAKIVKIERTKYDGRVYNVRLGIKEKGEVFDTGDTTLFANGILTGDNAMQEFYGSAFNLKPKNVKDRLPREWHTDYENSLKQQKPH